MLVLACGRPLVLAVSAVVCAASRVEPASASRGTHTQQIIAAILTAASPPVAYCGPAGGLSPTPPTPSLEPHDAGSTRASLAARVAAVGAFLRTRPRPPALVTLIQSSAAADVGEREEGYVPRADAEWLEAEVARAM